MPPTTSYSFGDVVLVPFPFTNQTQAKQRPAVIVSSSAYNARRLDIVLMAITGQVHTPLEFGETQIAAWQQAGLLKLSVVKPLVFTLEKPLVIKSIGRLEPADRATLETTLRSILASP
jgi:mRNA interferase MazF